MALFPHSGWICWLHGGDSAPGWSMLPEWLCSLRERGFWRSDRRLTECAMALFPHRRRIRCAQGPGRLGVGESSGRWVCSLRNEGFADSERDRRASRGPQNGFVHSRTKDSRSLRRARRASSSRCTGRIGFVSSVLALPGRDGQAPGAMRRFGCQRSTRRTGPA